MAAPTVKEFTEVLENEPFCIYEKLNLPEETITNIIDRCLDKSTYVNTELFRNKVFEMMHKYEIRTRTFLDLRKHLDSNGTNIEKAISRIKNSALENL